MIKTQSKRVGAAQKSKTGKTIAADRSLDGGAEACEDDTKNRGVYASGLKRSMEHRLRMRELERLDRLMALDDQDLNQDGISKEDFITKCDKQAVLFLTEVAQGLVPGVTMAQRLDAAKQIRDLAEREQAKAGTGFQGLQAGSFGEVLQALNHKKAVLTSSTPADKPIKNMHLE